jgi:hypothetical protein
MEEGPAATLGLVGVKRVLVIASLPMHMCGLLLGGAFSHWIQDASWRTVGRTEGLGEIPVLSTPTGIITFL